MSTDTYPDAFGFVLLLLALQREFDEKLLQLLIAVIDTELFKTAK